LIFRAIEKPQFVAFLGMTQEIINLMGSCKKVINRLGDEEWIPL